MKKVWMIMTEEVSADYGRHLCDITLRALYTDEAGRDEAIEAEKAKIEAKPAWWMGVAEAEDKRPKVWARALEVEGL